MAPQKSQRFSEETLRLLQKAGWWPERSIGANLKLPNGFDIHPVALKVLEEFNHLQVGQSKPGIDRAQSTIIFDPLLAIGERERFKEYENFLQRNLYPLGEVDGGYHFLAIDETEFVFLIMDDCWFVDVAFDTALDRLLLGKSLQPVDETGHW